MKKAKRVSLSLLLVLAMMLAMTSCASSASTAVPSVQASDSSTTAASSASPTEKEKVTLKIYAQYSDDSEKVPYDYAKAAMQEIMPEVELELIQQAQDDDQKIKTYAAAGNLPDIFGTNLNLIRTFQESGNILQLDPYVKELGVDDLFLDSAKSTLYDEDGHIYAIPNDTAWVSGVFYNKAVFEKYGVAPPKNIDELVAAVKVFSKNDIIPLAIFAKEKWPGVQLFDMIASRENSMGILGFEKSDAKTSDTAYSKAVEKIKRLVDAGMVAPGAFNMGYDEALALFVEGKAAMLINGGWATLDLGPKMGDNAGLLIYPFADPGQEEAAKVNMSGGGSIGGYAVSPHSKYKDLAAKFAIQFSLKAAEGRVIKRGTIPILKNSPEPETPYTQIQQDYIDMVSQAKSTTAFPWGMSNTKIRTALEDNVQRLLTGDYAVADFIADTDKVITSAR